MWCIEAITPKYRKRMYRILEVYNKPYDPHYSVIGLDEAAKQLLEDLHAPIRMTPEKSTAIDGQYRRKGTASIFVAVEPKAGLRYIEVTARRTRQDYAQFIRTLVNRYPHARKLRIIQDNLNTHTIKSLYVTFSQRVADRLVRKCEFIQTPKHGSWLNVAEIEINVLEEECTDRRFPTIEFLRSEVTAYMKERNANRAQIEWKATRADIDKKLAKHYLPKN